MHLSTRQKRTIIGCLVLCTLTFLAFFRVLHNGFINYDDPDYVTGNPHVLSGLSWANVRWAFTTTRASNWNPLTWLSHMLDVQLFGLNPKWHHLVSLLLHTANALVLFLLLQKITGTLYPSFFVAAFFAVHPLHVESVAWASERKDVLSTLFFLLTLWAYAIYARARVGLGQPPEGRASDSQREPGASEADGLTDVFRRQATWFYLLALALYALGLMTKPMLVTVPFLLMLLDYWPLRRFEGIAGSVGVRNPGFLALEKVPFFLLAAGSSAITFLSQKVNYSVLGGLPMRLRVASAVATYVKYLGKTVWPSGLAIFYPDPNARYFARHQTAPYPVSEQWPAWQIIAAGLLLAAVSVLIWLRHKREPWLVTGWFWFLGMLVPVIGIVQAGVQVMADHYTYIPLIGIFILTAWSAAELAERFKPARVWLVCAGALFLAACAFVTQRQVLFWRDNQTIFAHALAVTSRNPVAEWMIGSQCAQQGQLGLAQTHFRLALAADPYQVEAHSALGSLFELEGRTELATNEYRISLRMKPSDEFARLHLAGLLRKLGRSQEALAEYQTAARWNPDSVEANYQAGALLLDAGDLPQAARYLEIAARLKPDYADALLCLSDLRSQQGRSLEALSALREVVRLYPTNFELRVNFGSMLWKAGLREDGLVEYREALRLSPSHPMIHYDLGTALLAQGKLAEASKEFREAVRLKPDYLEAAADLGRALAAQGKFKEAQEAFQNALQLSPTNASLQVHLGTALLMDGQTNAATAAFAAASQLQPDLANRYLAEGKSLTMKGELNAALARFNTAVCLQPNSAYGLRSLAWLLATHPQPQMRDGRRALILAQRAVEMAPTDTESWASLDVAYAETGSFQEAIRAAEKVRQLALADGAVEVVRIAEERIARYRRSQPYHLN